MKFQDVQHNRQIHSTPTVQLKGSDRCFHLQNNYASGATQYHTTFAKSSLFAKEKDDFSSSVFFV
jgi:hypothetical protein